MQISLIIGEQGFLGTSLFNTGKCYGCTAYVDTNGEEPSTEMSFMDGHIKDADMHFLHRKRIFRWRSKYELIPFLKVRQESASILSGSFR